MLRHDCSLDETEGSGMEEVEAGDEEEPVVQMGEEEWGAPWLPEKLAAMEEALKN